MHSSIPPVAVQRCCPDVQSVSQTSLGKHTPLRHCNSLAQVAPSQHKSFSSPHVELRREQPHARNGSAKKNARHIVPGILDQQGRVAWRVLLRAAKLHEALATLTPVATFHFHRLVLKPAQKERQLGPLLR